MNYILKHTGIRHSFAFVLFRLIIAGLVTVGQAGTNPNEATRLEYDEYNNTWSFTWWGHVGNTYFIQQSDDLLSWQYMPFIIEGENKVAEWQFSNDQNTTFVRLKYTDMPTSDPRNDDFDSDDINNWSELLQQSDPLATDDQNSNGIADDWELFWNDQFAVFPRTVSATLTHRDSTIQQLYLNNPVSPDTNFTVTLSNNLAGTQIVYDYEDNLTGGAIYNWTEISTTGTLLADISETDNAAQEVVLNNFTFPFYGTSYDQVYVASNGLLTFDSPSADSGNDAIPYEYEPNNFIALLWDDLNTNDAIADDGGEVYFQEFADRMIVQYERVMRDSDSDRSTQSNTFQVVLHASGLIDVHYKEIGGYTGSTTIGIEDSSGTNGIEVFYNGYRTIYPTFELSNGLALSYTPQSAKFVQVSPLTGTTTTGSSSTLEVNFNSYDLAPGTYATDIEIAHSGTGTTPWIITAVLEVINTPATINLYQPLDGQVYWSDETVTFSAYVYDSDFGIERVDYLVNGAVEDQDISGSYYSGSWSPTVGQHEVIARAVDLYGTTTDSVVVTITVLADSDFDRMEDEWEQQYFGSLAEEASADFDGDGIPNIFEYNHGTDPADALSKLTFAETQTSDYTYFLVDETLATETDVAKTSLSAAINRANDFDVIEVRPGTYHEALGTLYDRLYVFSTAGARNTTIDTSGLDDRALTLRSESVFSGLSFRGADSEYTYFDGGAVYLSIYGDQNKPRFIGCRFIDNVVGDRGGAIYIGSGDPLFIACTITGNLGGNGNAIYNNSSSNDITLVNTLLWNPGTSPEIDGQTASVIFDHSLTRDDITGNVLIDAVDQDTDHPGLAYDYSLATGSIARDRGSLDTYSDYVNLPDCDGEAVLATRDIGADEFIDSDGDGLPDWIELQAGIDLNATDDNDLDLLNNLEDYENMGNPFLDDTDGDGLLDGDEFYADGTHGDTDGYTTGVNNPDTDDDSLSDGWEVDYGFNPTSANAPSTDSDGDGLTDKQEFSSGGNPFSGDTDNNGMSDALEYRYEMNLSTHVDSDADGMPDDYETAFGLSPTDPSDASLDRDSDALSNLEEYQLGTQANYFDSDGDLLGDGWEVNQGLNPSQANLLNDDSDQDGLDTYDEYLNGTNPSLGDSDSDGTPDDTEVAQGSNPANANDNGQPPAADKLQEVNFTVGDPSGSHSEHWEMTITGLGADTRVMRLSNRNFGTMTVPTPYKLWKDSNYEITIAHLGTKQTENGPDYDWQAQVEGLPTTNVLSGGATHTDASRFSVIHNHWILDNEDGLLGIVNQSFNNSNYASDKSAKLLKVEFGYPNIANKEINTKNLATTEYGDFEKCVARVWSSSTIEMNDYLENWNTMPSEVKELLEWEVDGNIQTSSNLNIGSVPFDHEISFFKIGVKVKGTPQILDRLILTVIPESTETNFNAWYSSESSDTGWLGELPPLYNNLGVENNDPEPAACDPQLWKSPDSKNSLYHPGASFEMRSVETSAGHGHQAMYRFNGALITSGLGAGSADRASPSIFSTSHRNQDVRPFIWAAQLDGNPIQGNSTTFPTNLNQPILHDGDNLAKYFDVRPIIANGRPSLSPGDCETQQE